MENESSSSVDPALEEVRLRHEFDREALVLGEKKALDETVRSATFAIVGDPGPLFAALANARQAYQPVLRSRAVDVHSKPDAGGNRRFLYTFHYAPLDVVLDATMPALAGAGLAFLQPVSREADGYKIRTILGHSSGSYIITTVTIPPQEDIQKLGSAITYLRRYAAQNVLGVAAEEDDDGNAANDQQAQTSSKKPPEKPAAPPPRQQTRLKTEPPSKPQDAPVAEKAAPVAEQPKVAPSEPPAPSAASIIESAADAFSDETPPAEAPTRFVDPDPEPSLPASPEQEKKFSELFQALGFRTRLAVASEMHYAIVGSLPTPPFTREAAVEYMKGRSHEDAVKIILHLKAHAPGTPEAKQIESRRAKLENR